jgi:hypothetical protein
MKEKIMETEKLKPQTEFVRQDELASKRYSTLLAIACYFDLNQ